MGRKSTFDPLVAEKIIVEVASGETLREICRTLDIPASTVRGWVIDNYEGFAERYARARELQVEAWSDELIADAEDSSRDTKTMKARDGSEYPVPDQEWIQRSRLRIDTKKWLMSKLLPKKYGEKLDVQNTHEAGDSLLKALEGIAINGNSR